jgi:pilus assembly protein Flp/PilA
MHRTFSGVQTTGRVFFPADHSERKEHRMRKLKNAVTRFMADDEGAALAEYGILIAFIAIVAIVAVTFFGSRISGKFSQLANSYT